MSKKINARSLTELPDDPPQPGIAGGTINIGFIGKGHPLSIFTWIGGKTAKLDIWDNQGLLQQCPGDWEDTDLFPDGESLEKLSGSNIAYIHNHGGTLTTGIQSGRVDILAAGLGFPKEEHKGPSVILYVGCKTGKEKYASGFGILPKSSTKVFIGFNFDPYMAGFKSDSFQESFFAAFASGVSINDACKKGYDAIKKKENPLPFGDMISIIGNGNLTLDQVRKSLDHRDAFLKKVRDAGVGHLCGAVCKDFKKYGFCDRPVRVSGQTCWQH